MWLSLCVQLSARPDRLLAMHTELRDTSVYLEHLALGFLVCPSLLLHPEARYMELFRQTATDQLVVTLYRELVSPPLHPFLLPSCRPLPWLYSL